MREISRFLKDSKDHGIWYGLTGETFSQSLMDLWDFIVASADYMLMGSMLFMILAICGSKQARGWTWWTVVSYLLIQSINMMVKGGI